MQKVTMQGCSCKQPELTIYEASDTVTGTTGKAGPKGLRVDRMGIADHLSLTLFGSLASV